MSNNVAHLWVGISGYLEMSILMKNPQTGFTYPIDPPLKGFHLFRILRYVRFWFAALIVIKAQRPFGLIGLALVVATIGIAIVSDDKALSGIPAVAYVAIGLYFAPKIPKFYAQHYLSKGWVFADPEAPQTIAARQQWQL